MAQAIKAYREVTVTDKFREAERLRSLARSNEAAALRHAREVAAAKEREKWQSVVAAGKATISEQAARIAELEKLLNGDKQ